MTDRLSLREFLRENTQSSLFLMPHEDEAGNRFIMLRGKARVPGREAEYDIECVTPGQINNRTQVGEMYHGDKIESLYLYSSFNMENWLEIASRNKEVPFLSIDWYHNKRTDVEGYNEILSYHFSMKIGRHHHVRYGQDEHFTTSSRPQSARVIAKEYALASAA